MLDDNDTFTNGWNALDQFRACVDSTLTVKKAFPEAKPAFTSDCKWLRGFIMTHSASLDEEIFATPKQ